jgi:tetratricopeptide (TPR) repeat protein
MLFGRLIRYIFKTLHLGAWALSVLLALKFDLVAGALLANVASIEYLQGTVTDCSYCMEHARQLLGQATKLEVVARWHELLGLIYYRQGDSSEALQQLQIAVNLSPHPRIWAEMGNVYDTRGEPDLSVTAYERGGAYANEGRLLVNLLKLVEEQIENREFTLAQERIEQVLALDSNNLWAWRQLSKPPLGPTPEAYQHIHKYRLSNLADPRLGHFNALAASDLIKHRIWTFDDGLNMTRVLLAESLPVEAALVLDELRETFPRKSSADIRLLETEAEVAGELRDHEAAALLWEIVVANKENPGSAWCMLGSQGLEDDRFSDAREAYTKCRNSGQDNYTALTGLRETCMYTGDQQCVNDATRQLESEFSILAAVAEQLQVDEASISLEPQPVINGSFEEQGRTSTWLPQDWNVGIWDGYQHDRAAFYLGLDDRSMKGDLAALLIGLWRVSTEESSAYAEIQGAGVQMPARSAYVMSFFYQTECLHGWIFLGDGRSDPATIEYEQESGELAPGKLLPGTGRSWKQVVAIGYNATSQPVYITPVLRLWGTGSVWLDDVQIHTMSSPDINKTTYPVLIR